MWSENRGGPIRWVFAGRSESGKLDLKVYLKKYASLSSQILVHIFTAVWSYFSPSCFCCKWLRLKTRTFFLSSVKWLGNMKTDWVFSGLLRGREQVVGSYWMGPRRSDSPDSSEKTQPAPWEEIANEILESLVSGFNLDIQYDEKFWRNKWNGIAQRGHVSTGLWHVWDLD